MDTAKSTTPTQYAIVLFNGFQALDAFGPLDILNLLSREQGSKLSLYVLAATKDAVSTAAPDAGQSVGQAIVPTHSFDDAPQDIEVLIVPGGHGTRSKDNIQPAVQFLKARFPTLRYLLTVCTGAAVASQAGVLSNRKATTNKMAFEWVTEQTGSSNVQWQRQARWVCDGNVWTASGVSAGMDMMYAFVAEQHGADTAAKLAWLAEYRLHSDPHDDPFASQLATDS